MGSYLDDENYCQGCDTYLEDIEKNVCDCGEGPFCQECLVEHEELCISDEDNMLFDDSDDQPIDDDDDFYDDDPNDDYFD
jgi:hypothetical protein